MTVYEEIRVGPQALNRYDADWMDRLISWFKLAPLLERSPFRLSGGEKKRVAFAAALAARPAILALDEPTAGQDDFFCMALTKAIDSLLRNGTTVLIVTHALHFAEQVADEWFVMANGTLLAHGTPDRIMADRALMTKACLMPTERFLWQQRSHH